MSKSSNPGGGGKGYIPSTPRPATQRPATKINPQTGVQPSAPKPVTPATPKKG